ncbi:UNC-like C-terminal-domain-containing protein [Syncephalastrum racemosum]|uniref:UNC-like C-terminal-domain-containing protein n=1 Tax=Syncephalastrum racemosum TaxID=13706 RepID=A0A1X2H8U9_SYNRA|nr:UNC-like C-terminal-domain-containing protein [Syncephalastrum racemosum]
MADSPHRRKLYSPRRTESNSSYRLRSPSNRQTRDRSFDLDRFNSSDFRTTDPSSLLEDAFARSDRIRQQSSLPPSPVLGRRSPLSSIHDFHPDEKEREFDDDVASVHSDESDLAIFDELNRVAALSPADEFFERALKNDTQKQSEDSYHRQEGIMWPMLVPYGERLYYATAYVIFLVLFSVKEVAYSMVFLVDMMFCFIVANPVFFFLRSIGLCPDKQYVNPFRMSRKHSGPLSPLSPFLVLACCAYVWIIWTVSSSEWFQAIQSNVPSLTHLGGGHTSTAISQPSSTVTDVSLKRPREQHPEDIWQEMLRHNQKAFEDMVGRIVDKFVMDTFDKKKDTFAEWIEAEVTRQRQMGSVGRKEGHMDLEPLVQAAIQKLSSDTLAQPDFALATRGSRVIPSLTSKTFVPGADNWMQHILRNAFSMGPPTTSPLIALMPDTNVGNCWPMQGQNGSLGILLSEPAYIHGFTVEHVGKELLTDRRTAPKEISIHGLSHYEHGLFSDTYKRVLLGKATYNVTSDLNIQTFPLYSQRASRFMGVQVQIESNWGNPDYTCLYRIRIHGSP